MRKLKNICICGGGNVGTVLCGVALSKGYDVSLLTGHPENWNRDISVSDFNGNKFEGTLNTISNSAKDIIPFVDIVILCLPGNVIEHWIKEISPYLKNDTYLGSVFCSSGFFPIAISNLCEQQPLFGLQRVPFISRVIEYGKTAALLGYRKEIRMSVWNVSSTDLLVSSLSDIFMTPISILTSPLAVTLTNSNPLLHPSRLYNLFKDYNEVGGLACNVLFYGDWDDASSQMLIDCDAEFQKIIECLGIAKGEIIPILEYYESTDAKSLTSKISSIESWHNLNSPMIQRRDGKYAPDWNSRYFIEDIPNGLFVIKVLAHLVSVETPTIDKILRWYQHATNQVFIEQNGEPAWNERTKSISVLNPSGLNPLLRNGSV